MEDRTSFGSDIYQDAVDTYGIPAQMNQVIEECAEAILAINHWRRKRITTEEMVEEFADVYLMMMQMEYIFPIEFRKMLDYKTEMLYNRLKKHKDKKERKDG